jgi:hypothetical protein
MAGLDWHQAGRQAGQEIAEAGGSAANVEIDTIGFELGRSWLDGVLDALSEKGLSDKMISVSPSMVDFFRATDEWQEDGTYRGSHLMSAENDDDHARIVVAA